MKKNIIKYKSFVFLVFLLFIPVYFYLKDYLDYSSRENPLCCWKDCIPCNNFKHWQGTSGKTSMMKIFISSFVFAVSLLSVVVISVLRKLVKKKPKSL